MQKNAAAKKLRERRSEPRNQVNQSCSVGLTIDGIDLTYEFRVRDKTATSISFLVKNQLDILLRLKTGGTLFIVYPLPDSSQLGMRLETVIRHITKCGTELEGQYLVGTEILGKLVLREGSNAIFFCGDNGGRRTGLEQRIFSYDAHMPERRSNSVRRSSVDRRNGFMVRMNPRQWRDTERRAAFLWIME